MERSLSTQPAGTGTRERDARAGRFAAASPSAGYRHEKSSRRTDGDAARVEPPVESKKGSKRARQYEHIKDSLKDQGAPRTPPRRSRRGR